MNKDIIFALQDRLKNLSKDAKPDELAYLAKAMEIVSGKTTTLDIVGIGDQERSALSTDSKKHLEKLESTKSMALSALENAHQASLEELDNLNAKLLKSLETKSASHLSLLDQTKVSAVTQIQTMVPRHPFHKDALPIIFGVLSRSNDHFGTGGFKTELGKWAQDVTKADTMLELLTGAHEYTTEYSSFYKPPQLYFLQGSKGNFSYKELYERYKVSSNIISYPAAGIGVIFVKNTTNKAISRTIKFGGSSAWSSGYEGMSMFVGRSGSTKLNWSMIYSNRSKNPSVQSSALVEIQPNQTIAIMLYTSAYNHTGNYSNHTQFMQWYVHSVRSEFLTDGLAVDLNLTNKAWQCPGFNNTYDIWREQMTIYLRFENGMQVETITVGKKPKEDVWFEAPKNFDWSKEYMLTKNGIEVCTKEELEAWMKTQNKSMAQKAGKEKPE